MEGLSLNDYLKNHLCDVECWVKVGEGEKKVMNWAIFELWVEKDNGSDNQSGELQVSETEH